jgi:hypothetical protein
MKIPKNIGRDLIEYILLISFVSLGSSFVFVSEIEGARAPQISHGGGTIQMVIRTPKRSVIFGSSTKRHIK